MTAIDILLVDEYNADPQMTIGKLANKHGLKYFKLRKMLQAAGVEMKRGRRKGSSLPAEVVEERRRVAAHKHLTFRMRALIDKHGFDAVAAAYNAAVDEVGENAE